MIVRVPKIIDLLIPPMKWWPCSMEKMIIVERKIAGNTENIPLMTSPMFERSTAMVMIVPANSPRKASFEGV